MLRRVLVVAIVLAISGAGARAFADVVTAQVTLPSTVVHLSSSTPASLNVEFPVRFSSISRITFTGTFSGDLFDYGEQWGVTFAGTGFLDQNIFSSPRSTFSKATTSAGSLAEFLDGRQSFQFVYTSGTADLSSLRIVIEGVAIPNPEASAFLLLTSVVGGMAVVRYTRAAWARRAAP